MAKKNDSPELTDVTGIGPARAKQLKKVGIHSPKQLAQYNPETVAQKTKLSESRAKKLVEAAEKVSTSTTKKTSKKKSASKKASKKSSKKKTKKSKSSKKTDSKAATKAAAQAMEDIIARARDHFKQAPDEHRFHLRSGDTLKDLRELAEALEEMQEHVFRHHVNDERHDFANWVQEVLDEHALAEELRQARKHPDAHGHVIYRHITRRVW